MMCCAPGYMDDLNILLKELLELTSLMDLVTWNGKIVDHVDADKKILVDRSVI